MDKPVLYCSERCQFSKDVLTRLSSQKLLDNFQVFVIEKESSKPPLFVDRVPFLFHDNRMMYDEDLFFYLDNITKSKNQKELYVTSATTYDFAFVDDSSTEGSAHNHFLSANSTGAFEDASIETPEETFGTDKDKSMSLEELVSRREKDVNVKYI